MHTISEKKILLLRPEDISPSADQPRMAFDEYELRSLSESITANGIIEPLTVRRCGKNKYILISGERRLRAAKMAGLRRVPCVVHKTDEKNAALYSLIENLQRSKLNFFEEASAIDRLMGIYGITQSDMAMKLGMSQSALLNKLRLLKIDTPNRQRILSAGLTERHVRELLKIDKQFISCAIDAIIGNQLSVKQTESLINSIIYPEPQPESVDEPSPPVRKAAIGDIKLFANSLSKLLETMKNAGIDASSSETETEDYVEYEVRIEKKPPRQLTLNGI